MIVRVLTRLTGFYVASLVVAIYTGFILLVGAGLMFFAIVEACPQVVRDMVWGKVF